MEVEAVMNNPQDVTCDIPSCKEACLVDFREFYRKCSIFPLFFSAEHYQSPEIAVTNVE
jgi:hypothetical protein